MKTRALQGLILLLLLLGAGVKTVFNALAPEEPHLRMRVNGVALGSTLSQVRNQLGQEDYYEADFRVSHYEGEREEEEFVIGFDGNLRAESLSGSVLEIEQNTVRTGDSVSNLKFLGAQFLSKRSEVAIIYEIDGAEIVIQSQKNCISRILLTGKQQSQASWSFENLAVKMIRRGFEKFYF